MTDLKIGFGVSVAGGLCFWFLKDYYKKK